MLRAVPSEQSSGFSETFRRGNNRVCILHNISLEQVCFFPVSVEAELKLEGPQDFSVIEMTGCLQMMEIVQAYGQPDARE
jgi:hypothetical protein